METYRFWYVPGEPSTVIVRIGAHARAGDIQGESFDPRGGYVWANSNFPVKDRDVVRFEQLAFGAAVLKAGRAALRADAEVVPAGAKCAGSDPY